MQLQDTLIKEAEAVYTETYSFAWLFREAATAGMMKYEDCAIANELYLQDANIWNEVRFMFAYLLLLVAGEEE